MAVSEPESPSRSIAAVERAMDVLLLFGRSGRADLGVTEIATELGITKAAVHRILTALRNRDLIAFEPSTRRYTLGHAAIALGRAYMARTDLRIMAAPELRRLASLTGETVTLSIRRGDTRMYVDQVVPDHELRVEVSLGVPYPLYAGSSSKVILAYLGKQDIDDYLRRQDLVAFTDDTITSRTALRAELTATRKRGYAISLGERQIGVASIAAPILDHDGGVMAAISVCAPLSRFEPRIDEFVPILLKSGRAISAQLGYAG
ncbi:IclR family transcriptional regulator [Nocardia sp. NBC_01377]|uniref:IclR family transcriptional regulator n=1 Tax=Nocardia sp. NBC_01377 TaxID=2903595 RepID=UPI003244E38D